MTVDPDAAATTAHLRTAPVPESAVPVDPGIAPFQKRSPVERCIVQGGIVLLLVVLAVELRAQKGFSGTIAALRVLSDDGEKERAMTEVERVISLFPSRDIVAENAIETTTEYSWFSFFKNEKYRLNIVASKATPSEMLRYYTGTTDPMTVKEPDPKDVVPRPEGGFSLSPPKMSGGDKRGGTTEKATPNGRPPSPAE